jgi:hypothetical protein
MLGPMPAYRVERLRPLSHDNHGVTLGADRPGRAPSDYPIERYVMTELYVVGDCKCRHCGAEIETDKMYCPPCAESIFREVAAVIDETGFNWSETRLSS